MNNIKVINKCNCCGCRACADACPISCIKMREDHEGFFYPIVEEDKCISCGKCKKVCPILRHQDVKYKPIDDIAYAYLSSDVETIKNSSSGGAFSFLMDTIEYIYTDFAIVGAAFDGVKVRHLAVKSRSAANIFKKSKYIQSDTTGIFKEVKNLLKAGTHVLFSGTPCQVAALKLFLEQDYINLFTVDIVCHGVPNQSIFNEYLNELEKKNHTKVESIEFKYKKNFSSCNPNPRTMNVYFDNGKILNMDINESEFLYAYYTGLINRPSCENCKFACSSRCGDITLGDFWGIEKIQTDLNSLKGVSLIRFNSKKSKFLIDLFKKNGTMIETSWNFACLHNNQLCFPAVSHRNRNKFFKLRSSGVGFYENITRCKKPDKIYQKVWRKLSKLLEKRTNGECQ